MTKSYLEAPSFLLVSAGLNGNKQLYSVYLFNKLLINAFNMLGCRNRRETAHLTVPAPMKLTVQQMTLYCDNPSESNTA